MNGGEQTWPALGTALAIAARGWPVVALHSVKDGRCTCGKGSDCTNEGKHPRYHPQDLTNGWRDASADPDAISRWAARWPGCNFGLALELAGLVAIDVDTLAAHGVDGPAALAELEGAHGLMPHTVTTATPTGGWHLLYRRPHGWQPTNVDVAPGVELLGSQLVVLPGSCGAGGDYRWQVAPDDVPELPELPSWLLPAPVATGGAAAVMAKPRRTTSSRDTRYLDKAAAGIRSDLAGAVNGTRHRAMVRAAVRLGQLQGGGYPLAESDALATYMAGAAACGILAERGGDREATAAWNWGWKAGLADPQAAADTLANKAPAGLLAGDGAAAGPSGRTRVVRLADVEPMMVRYLWNLRIPFGALTGCIGDPGVGKSSLAAAIAAAESLGVGLPGELPREPGRVLILSAEDHLAAVIRPRMDALGADLTRVHVLDGSLCLADADGRMELEAALQEYRPSLVTIDPIQSYLGGGIDMHRANEMRSVLEPLADLAERYDAAIMLVGHLTKATGAKAIHRALGSVDFAAAVRSMLLAGADPDDNDERALFHEKNNLGPLADPIGYSLADGTCQWTASTTLTSATVLAAPTAAGCSIADAEEFLRQVLASGPRPVRELESEAEAAGLAWTTIRNKAKKRLGVSAERVGGAGKDGWWQWRLPAEPSVNGNGQGSATLSAPNSAKGTAGALSVASGPLQTVALSAPEHGQANGSDAPNAVPPVPATWTCTAGHASVGDHCTRCGQPRPGGADQPSGMDAER